MLNPRLQGLKGSSDFGVLGFLGFSLGPRSLSLSLSISLSVKATLSQALDALPKRNLDSYFAETQKDGDGDGPLTVAISPTTPASLPPPFHQAAQ